MTSRPATLLALTLLVTSCGGVDELQRCIDHSVEEGVSQERAEAGCRDVVGEDG